MWASHQPTKHPSSLFSKTAQSTRSLIFILTYINKELQKELLILSSKHTEPDINNVHIDINIAILLQLIIFI